MKRPIATTMVLTVSTIVLLACTTSDENDEGIGEDRAAAEGAACDLAGILKRCTVADTSYCKAVVTPKSEVPGTAKPVPGGEGKFNCSNFSGNLCRCAEKICPGSVGKTVFQQSIHCTYYKDCSAVSRNHALDVVCEPNADGKTKKCHCVEPQSVFTGSDNAKQFPDGPIYGSGDIGINDAPPATFCEAVYCNASLGKEWKSCPGGTTYSTCNNMNKEDGCPSSCCKAEDGSVQPYCLECEPDSLKACPKPAVVAPAMPAPAK